MSASPFTPPLIILIARICVMCASACVYMNLRTCVCIVCVSVDMNLRTCVCIVCVSVDMNLRTCVCIVCVSVSTWISAHVCVCVCIACASVCVYMDLCTCVHCVGVCEKKKCVSVFRTFHAASLVAPIQHCDTSDDDADLSINDRCGKSCFPLHNFFLFLSRIMLRLSAIQSPPLSHLRPLPSPSFSHFQVPLAVAMPQRPKKRR